MHTVDIRYAKAHLSRSIEGAADGEPFIIAKAGKPMVKVVAVDRPNQTVQKRLGFMRGEFTVPDDFDRMGQDEINQLFQ